MILLVGKKNNEEFWEIQKDPLKALCALSKTYDYKVFEMNGKMVLQGKSWDTEESIQIEIRELTPRGVIYWSNHMWDAAVCQALKKPGYSRRYKNA